MEALPDGAKSSLSLSVRFLAMAPRAPSAD